VTIVQHILQASQETKVFLLMAAFGLIVATIYWFVSYEAAGTVLLAGFGLATGVIAVLLAASDPTARRPARDGGVALDARGTTVGGTSGVDRPFADESGRLPRETVAPFAVGAGVALAATGLIFGLAPIIVGVLPLAWGAWSWLTSAGDELIATQRDEEAA
jgi:hypothetical protein